MKSRDRLQKMRALTQMIRDHDMARLQRLAAAQNLTREKLAQLPMRAQMNIDPALFSVQQAHLHWSAQQMMHLNLLLARQRAALIEQRAKTARSFGRADAVARLLDHKT
ncbi:MAG: hypothetical protein EA338_07095 [Roseinatronobacter sp.]|nr:MAG: hypothetical protein EA338_07095 [Roseinatronobacter sp.]